VTREQFRKFLGDPTTGPRLDAMLDDNARVDAQLETWNTCPDCGYTWKDETATPGLVHRTRLCRLCADMR